MALTQLTTGMIADSAVTYAKLATAQSNSRMVVLNFGTAGGLTQYRLYQLSANNSTTAFLGFSAEL